MNKIKTGDKFKIQCYKHDGTVHRSWDEAVVIDVKNDYIVFGNNRTKVIEAHGTWWRTNEPAVMYFFKDKWFNIIAQLKKDGVYYYCNIASPFVVEENTIKYIDYDLDLRVFPDGRIKILDKSEYEYHRKLMNYSDKLDMVIKTALNLLIESYESKSEMFNNNRNLEYSKKYFEIVSKN